jgi:hypothetical protein
LGFAREMIRRSAFADSCDRFMLYAPSDLRSPARAAWFEHFP